MVKSKSSHLVILIFNNHFKECSVLMCLWGGITLWIGLWNLFRIIPPPLMNVSCSWASPCRMMCAEFEDVFTFVCWRAHLKSEFKTRTYKHEFVNLWGSQSWSNIQFTEVWCRNFKPPVHIRGTPYYIVHENTIINLNVKKTCCITIFTLAYLHHAIKVTPKPLCVIHGWRVSFKNKTTWEKELEKKSRRATHSILSYLVTTL